MAPWQSWGPALARSLIACSDSAPAPPPQTHARNRPASSCCWVWRPSCPPRGPELGADPEEGSILGKNVTVSVSFPFVRHKGTRRWMSARLNVASQGRAWWTKLRKPPISGAGALLIDGERQENATFGSNHFLTPQGRRRGAGCGSRGGQPGRSPWRIHRCRLLHEEHPCSPSCCLPSASCPPLLLLP